MYATFDNRDSRSIVEIGMSLNSISPLVGRFKPANNFNSVDFPQPDSPVMAVIFPAGMFRLTFTSAGDFLFGYVKLTLSTEISTGIRNLPIVLPRSLTLFRYLFTRSNADFAEIMMWKAIPNFLIGVKNSGAINNRNNADSNSILPATNLKPSVTATNAMLSVVINSNANDDINANFSTSNVAAEDFSDVDFNLAVADSILPNIFKVVIADNNSLNAPFNRWSSVQARALRSAVALPIRYSRSGAIGKVTNRIAAVIQSSMSAAIRNIGRRVITEMTFGATLMKNSSAV